MAALRAALEDKGAPPGAPYARVFVGNLPLPRDMPTAEKFQAWFDAEMRKLDNSPAAPKADSALKNKAGPALKNEADAAGEVTGREAGRYIAAVEGWSSTDGVCLLCFEELASVSLALRLNGSKCKTTHLSVTLYQCLPEPSASAIPLITDSSALPLTHLPLWRNKGYLVFVETSVRRVEDQEFRSLFEALGGPLENLFVFRQEDQLPLCGRCSFSNSLIIESVIHRLRSTDKASITVANLIDPRRGEVLTSLEAGGAGLSQCSMSEQICADPVTAMMIRTSRLIASKPSRIVQLAHTIPLEDIVCDTLRSELLSAITEEAAKYGHLEGVVCPMPDTRLGQLGPDAAAGKVFLEYSDLTAARRAQAELNGKQLRGRILCASFYPILFFELKQYHLFSP